MGNTEEERRLVTVLFADLEGFTSLAERLDPEDVRDIQTEYFRLMRGEIKRYGGTLDKYAGDAVLAIFGVPTAHEDDAERAVRCALAMQTGMEALAEETYRRWGKRVALRVGVNTGEVVTGVWDVEGRQDYAVSGDVVNTAARLQTAAEPGGVLVGMETRQLTEQCVRFGEPQDLSIRGKVERVVAYPALGLPDRVAERWETLGRRAPLVGRDRELRQLLDLWERARDGEGQLVAVVGDAGVGKSRFVAEAAEKISARGEVRVVEGRCASYGQEISLWLVADLIRDLCRVTPHDTPLQVRGRLRADLAERLHDQDHETRAAASDVLGEVLGLPPGDSMVAAASPQIRRQVLIRTLRLLLAATQNTPTLLILQDLHWIDRASTDVLTEILPDVPGLRLMVVTTQRPGWSAEWSEWSWPERIRLRPLGERDAALLAGAVLGDVALSPTLQRYIGERTGGNPFFVEELLRTLRDTGDLIAVGEHVELAPGAAERLPPTLTEILLARLDRLEAQLRNLAQVASVIGRQFAVRLLAEVVGRETNALEMPLVKLQQAEIAFPRHGVDLEYAFKHALLRDVAYTTLLHKRRQTLHAATARAMASLYDPDEGAEMIAYHYSKTEEHMEAAEWLERAGDQAARKYNNQEALQNYQQARSRFEEAGADATTLARIDAKIGKMYSILGQHDQALAALERAADVFRRAGDVEAEARVMADVGWVHVQTATGAQGIEKLDAVLARLKAAQSSSTASLLVVLAYLHMVVHEDDKAVEVGREARAMAEKIGDDAVQAQASTVAGLALQHVGRHQEARQELGNAIRLAREMGDLDAQRRALTFLGATDLHVGDLEQSREHYAEAARLSHTIGDSSWEAMSIACVGLIDFHLGRWDTARAELEQATAEMLSPLYSSYPRRWLAQLSFAQGRYDGAADHLREARKTHDTARMFPHLRGPDSLVIEWKLMGAPDTALNGIGNGGQTGAARNAADRAFEAWKLKEDGNEAAETQAREALDRALSDRHVLSQIDAHRVNGVVLAGLGEARWSDAEHHFQESIKLAKRVKDPYAEARAHYEYGRALVQAGHLDQGRQELTDAQTQLQALSEVPYLQRTNKALDDLGRQ